MLIGPHLPQGLTTPATLIFADRLERNLTGMAAFARESRIALRPHAKTHKCVEIAHRQMELGARGLSVATVGEAEILTGNQDSHAHNASEVTNVFVAYPLWADDELVRRLRRLADRVKVTVGADSAEAVERLAPIARDLRVMIEIDCGLARSGVPPAGVTVVARAAERIGLELSGVFTFPGQSYGPGAGAEAAEDEARALAQGAEILVASGFRCEERSGGSSPSARLVRPGTLNEIRPGVYVFNDAQQVELGVATMDDVALMVAVDGREPAGAWSSRTGRRIQGPRSGPDVLGDGPWAACRLAGCPRRRALGAPRSGRVPRTRPGPRRDRRRGAEPCLHRRQSGCGSAGCRR